ncbi:MAG: hypothetical protein IPG53_19930 [Ignavibacteriales bacterium]|nr:hypothetical protein [Ignavibacteriales bacterium]
MNLWTRAEVNLFAEGSAIKRGQNSRGGRKCILNTCGRINGTKHLQRMSGIATAASEYAKPLLGIRAKRLDTRKQHWDILTDKLAVKTGGCLNHRTVDF